MYNQFMSSVFPPLPDNLAAVDYVAEAVHRLAYVVTQIHVAPEDVDLAVLVMISEVAAVDLPTVAARMQATGRRSRPRFACTANALRRLPIAVRSTVRQINTNVALLEAAAR